MSLLYKLHNLTPPAKQIIEKLKEDEILIAINEDAEIECNKLYIYELYFITYFNNEYYYYHSIFHNKYEMIKYNLKDMINNNDYDYTVQSLLNQI